MICCIKVTSDCGGGSVKQKVFAHVCADHDAAILGHIVTQDWQDRRPDQFTLDDRWGVWEVSEPCAESTFQITLNWVQITLNGERRCVGLLYGLTTGNLFWSTRTGVYLGVHAFLNRSCREGI